MTDPTPEVRELLQQAAQSRAEGSTWPHIAEKLGRPRAECESWPRQFPRLWQSLLRAARRRVEQDAAAEARSRLRVILREKDFKLCLAAAALLIKPRPPARAAKPILDPAGQEMADFISQIQGFSHDELDQTIHDFLAARGGASPVADPAGAP